ncbi:MAG: hypothetical protein A3H29_11690 [Acidobacteria bacterium RIFCSPLOWO2_02_FULL_67_21]|nr:MAG: hypothetical protein A3H29_11690 [Acidobacteria bacterium RIFCSPLOWO2_02_FULL_67_21]
MRWILAAALLAAVILPFKAAAHEDHAHKFMGTVSVVEEAQLELKTTDGKTVLFLLDAKTTFQRGKAKVDGKDLKVGERIVVSALEVTTGKTMTAQIVQLPAR